MQWLIAAIPFWGGLQVLVIVGHIVFSVWHGEFRARDSCPPDVNYILCGTPLTILYTGTKEVPELPNGQQEEQQEGLGRFVPDGLESLGRSFGGVLSLLWKVPVVIVSVMFFRYEILNDPSFLGLFGVIMQAASWVVTIAAIVAIIGTISGVIRG